MAAQAREHITNHWRRAHFKRVNFLIHELYIYFLKTRFLLSRADVGHETPTSPQHHSLRQWGTSSSTRTWSWLPRPIQPRPWQLPTDHPPGPAPSQEPSETRFCSVPRGQRPAGHMQGPEKQSSVYTRPPWPGHPGGIQKMQWSHSAGRRAGPLERLKGRS